MRARVRAGDPDAFSQLFDDHARSVYNHAFRLTGDWSVAEDVVSVTFLEAWRLRGRVDAEGGSLRPWLLGVATNVARNVNRALRRHEGALARLPPGGVVPDIAEEVAGRVDDDELLASVRVALGTLRRSEREVIALCVWAGLGYTEAAEALGVPVGTVRSRLSRARKRLRKLAVDAVKSSREPSRFGRTAGRAREARWRPEHADPGHTGSEHTGSEHTGSEHTGSGQAVGDARRPMRMAGETREPRSRPGQVDGDRDNAVRSVQERAL
ncbi:RNA polymerase sigma factor [Streptosporangium sp. NPDC001681]|uniref:RNA polymerase sigma factor n=1 Tax=Streptosporangium sp. NPDC001681 TaxID=3154395 RepID=UPI00331C8952